MEAEKLAEFHANLEAIQEVLQDDPTNEELLSVKRDLEEVIRYYTESAGGISKAAASQDPTKGDFARENAPSGAREETLKGDEMTNKAKGLIGRTCVISSDFKHGTISSLGELDADSGMPKTILVRLLDDAGTVKELDVAKVRLINQCDPSSFEEGSEMQALYNDGVWYDCTIKKIRVSRVVVYYQDYDEEDELPLDRIRPRPATTGKKTSGHRAKEPSKKIITTPAGYKIPASIVVKPGDPASVRESKRKQLEVIKRDQKRRKQEEEAEARQSAWQQHMKSAHGKFKFHTSLSARKPPPT